MIADVLRALGIPMLDDNSGTDFDSGDSSGGAPVQWAVPTPPASASQSPPTPDPKTERRGGLDIFVGGYLDNHMPGGGVMKGYADSYAKQTGRPTRYLPNGRIGQIADAIREGNADGGPVNLVGHSWGGPDVYDAAALATAKGLKVDNLITLDPVSGPSHAPHGPQHAGTWMNVVGSPSQPDRTDWITNFPGFSQKPSNLPIQQADQTVSVDRNHGDVDGMMRDSGARALLDRSRQLAPADSTDADMSASRPGPLNDDLPMDDWIAARQAQMQQGAAASAPGM